MESGRSPLARASRSLVVLGASAALVLVIASFLGRFDARLDLLAHLRLALLEGCLLALCVAFLARSRCAVLMLLAAIVLDVAPIVQLSVGRESVSNAAPRLRLVLFNVRQSNPRIVDVVAFARETQPDLIALQEVTPELDRAMAESHAFELATRELRPDPLSAALYRRVESGLRVTASEVLRADSSPVAVGFLRAECVWQGRAFVVIVPRVLPPSQGAAVRELRAQHLEYLRSLVRAANSCVVLGDLNTTPFSSDFHALIDATALLDSTRGFGYQPTWPSYGIASFARIPIDHLLHSRDFITADRRVGRDSLGSDHFPVVVDLAWRE